MQLKLAELQPSIVRCDTQRAVRSEAYVGGWCVGVSQRAGIGAWHEATLYLINGKSCWSADQLVGLVQHADEDARNITLH